MARSSFPPWIRNRLKTGFTYHKTEGMLHTLGIHTICTEAKCPNQGTCWQQGTATVLILGTTCTRNCPFCSVAHGTPSPVEEEEPQKIAQLAHDLGISYLVITSVTRDDVPDGGAHQFARVMKQCRVMNPDIRFEILTPDFSHNQDEALKILSEQLPFVFSHNIETVPELYPLARPGASYERSLTLLEKAHQGWPEIPIKSSLMLGLGETEEQVRSVMRDLREVGCTRICMGQYLQPSKQSLEVKEFITPERFSLWEEEAYSMGFTWVIAEPFARSSFKAERETTKI